MHCDQSEKRVNIAKKLMERDKYASRLHQLKVDDELSCTFTKHFLAILSIWAALKSLFFVLHAPRNVVFSQVKGMPTGISENHLQSQKAPRGRGRRCENWPIFGEKWGNYEARGEVPV